jgi:hypothetical protein
VTPTASSNNIGGVTLSNGTLTTTGTATVGTTLIFSNQLSVPKRLVFYSIDANSYYGVEVPISGGEIRHTGGGAADRITFGFTNSAATFTQWGQFTNSTLEMASNARILNGVGTVAAPAYTFVGDTAMGLYDPASNVLGVVTAGVERMRILSNGNVGIAESTPLATLHVTGNEIVTGFLRNALTPTQFDISGGNISNSATHTSSNFVTPTASSNNIGGVTLNNNAISTTGAIATGAAISNSVGGVTLSNTNLTLAGTITGSTANTNNVIGGVTLNNTNISNAGTITTGTGACSVGGVSLSNKIVRGVGSIVKCQVRRSLSSVSIRADANGDTVDTMDYTPAQVNQSKTIIVVFSCERLIIQPVTSGYDGMTLRLTRVGTSADAVDGPTYLYENQFAILQRGSLDAKTGQLGNTCTMITTNSDNFQQYRVTATGSTLIGNNDSFILVAPTFVVYELSTLT